MKLVIVSGRSGSGKSVALRVLEDLGYYCVDNIPVNLLPALTHSVLNQYDKVAVSIDVRNLPKSSKDLEEILDYLPGSLQLTILFLDANSNVLLTRYSETRRLHPLSRENITLSEAISRETELLQPIKNRADLLIDTSSLTVHQLAEQVLERLMGKKNRELVIAFQSFGFKYGVPKDIDYVFDARMLPNPHWEPELKPMTGLDKPVQGFLANQPLVTKFTWQVAHFLETWLPHLERNNRSYLNVAIGCTGGQHRSVFVAECLAQHFQQQGKNINIRHRELEKKKA